MIRRKIWATATFCLAVAGAARAQTGSNPALPSAPGATLPQPAASNAGMPRYIPRNYFPPAPLSYGSQPTNVAPPAATAAPIPAPPADLFAAENDPSSITAAPAAPTPGVAPMGPTPGATLIPPPAAAPMPVAPVIDATVQAPLPIPMGSGYGGTMMAGPMMQGPMLNGGPIEEAPYLSGMGTYGDGCQPCVWATGEYINWRFKSMKVPVLVATAPAGAPGTLLDPGTTAVVGGGNILENWQSGFRVRGGVWFPDGCSGLDVAFFHIDVTGERHNFASNGEQGLFRPFFNTAIRAEDARLVAFSDPNAGAIMAGTISTVASTMLWGAEANYRTGWGMGLGGKLDALIGYRYLRLHDQLSVDSRSTTLVDIGGVPAGTLITSGDRFDALNQFHGAQVGFAGEWQMGMLSIGMRATVAAGLTQQTVDIAGSTTAQLPGGLTSTVPGSLFAQTTNMGNHTQTRVSIVPEVGITVGYQCTNNIRIFGGYNVLCWTNTVRAGEQMNRAVNATFIADPVTGAVAPSGAPAPWFHHRDDNFYVHGYSVGVEFRW